MAIIVMSTNEKVNIGKERGIIVINLVSNGDWLPNLIENFKID